MHGSLFDSHVCLWRARIEHVNFFVVFFFGSANHWNGCLDFDAFTVFGLLLYIYKYEYMYVETLSPNKNRGSMQFIHSPSKSIFFSIECASIVFRLPCLMLLFGLYNNHIHNTTNNRRWTTIMNEFSPVKQWPKVSPRKVYRAKSKSRITIFFLYIFLYIALVCPSVWFSIVIFWEYSAGTNMQLRHSHDNIVHCSWSI